MKKEKIRIERESEEVKQFFLELKERLDELVLSISDWEEYFSRIKRLPFNAFNR